MKKLLHKNFFTLVEVLIAMGICVVGLCSVVIFFPIGANAARNASMASYAANVAEQILNFAKFCIETDLSDTGEGDTIGSEKFKNIAFRYFTSPTGLVKEDTNNDWRGWDPNKPWEYRPTSVCRGNEEAYPAGAVDYLLGKIKDSDTNGSSPAAIAFTPFSKGMTRYITNMLQTVTNDDFAKVTTEIIPYKNNVFKARFITRDPSKDADNTSEDSVYSDFDCFASLWATPISATSSSARVVNVPYAVRLHVTVSWPADLPWDSRQKREYTMDVFKQY